MARSTSARNVIERRAADSADHLACSAASCCSRSAMNESTVALTRGVISKLFTDDLLRQLDGECADLLPQLANDLAALSLQLLFAASDDPI